MAFNTAGANNIPFLYHWQRPDIGRLENTLATKTIYCPSPGSFNDPWDCKPQFDPRILLLPGEADRMIERMSAALPLQGSGWASAQQLALRRMFQSNYVAATSVVNQASAWLAERINHRYRVYCLGTDPVNSLMWAHYADCHRGVCLEYAVSEPSVIRGAMKCEYLEVYPPLSLADLGPDNLEALWRLVLIKAKCWEYEDEYRLVAFERSTVQTSGVLSTDSCMLQLPPGAISAVLVGCRGDYNVIRDLVKRVAPEVKVKRAVKIQQRFDLKIDE
jgi:hypothetical protein